MPNLNHLCFKYLAVVAFLFILYGCATVDYSTHPPDVSEFPSSALNYRVASDVNQSLIQTIQFLTSKGITFHQESIQPDNIIITSYIEEPFKATDRRVRRTAYKVNITRDHIDATYSSISVSWLVQSRGVRERTWRHTGQDTTYAPTHLAVIKNFYNDR